MSGVNDMLASMLDNKFGNIVLNFLHDVFLLIIGLTCLIGAKISPINSVADYFFSLMLVCIGLAMLLAVLAANTMAIKYDRLFKAKMIGDPNIESLYANIAVSSSKTLIRIRTNRVIMYVRAILLPQNTENNPNYPWFHGYNFRKNSSLYDKFLAFTMPTLVVLFAVFGVIYIVLEHL